jgi:hypothetical protein
MKVSIKLIFGLVIGLAGLYLSIQAGSVMFGIFFQDKLELTDRSMDQIHSVIEELQDGSNTTVIFYLDKGYRLISFDSGYSNSEDTILKPSGCSNKACLAVCSNKGGQEACLNSPNNKLFETVLTFESELPEGIILTTTKEYVTLEIERNGSKIKIHEVESD